jgi:heme/copper-type cytochrome/quinol oxidase subunit 2
MGRNFFVLAATLALFSLVSCGMQWSAAGPATANAGSLPGDASLWQTMSLVLMILALIAAVVGMLTTMYGQVKRRDSEQRERDRRYGG